MLNNSFFFIENIETGDTDIAANIRLHPGHDIYKGHFPGRPVTPGVVQIQLVKEILEHVLQKKLLLKTMGRCKFLKILDPELTPLLLITISVNVTEEGVKVNASGANGESVYFKFNALYTQ